MDPVSAQNAVAELAREEAARPRKEPLFWLPAPFSTMLRSMLKDERDYPVGVVFINALLIGIVGNLALLWLSTPGTSAWLRAAVIVGYYGLLYGALAQPLILGLHFGTHRSIFNNSLGSVIFLNILSPIIGIPPGCYYLHHVVMHHKANNGRHDLSSTMKFQRDSVLNFLQYWGEFHLSIIRLPFYAFTVNRYVLGAVGAFCMWGWFAMAWYIAVVHSVFFAWAALLGPYFVCSFALMLGNFTQHAFINPDCPHENMGLTLQAMNSHENQHCFLDGYHVTHHIHGGLHWSQLPLRFADEIHRYAEADALVFSDLGYMDITALIFTGQLERLAKYYVHYGQTKVPRTTEEIVAEFRRRLAPIVATE